MKRLAIRILALAMGAVLLLAGLSSCFGGNTASLQTVFSDLRMEETGEALAEIAVDGNTVAAHTGEELLLYERLPGESEADAMQRDPIAKETIAPSLCFRFSAQERPACIYSTFFVTFADGTPLGITRGFSSPKNAGKGEMPYLWKQNPKGLTVTDVALAASADLPHAVIEVSLSSLLPSSDNLFPFGGGVESLDAEALSLIDRRVEEAFHAGQQVSLFLSPKSNPSLLETAAVIDFLTARYADERAGWITALFLDGDGLDAADAETLLRASAVAMAQNTGGGRVYLHAQKDGNAEALLHYFSAVGDAVLKNGAYTWGASFSLSLSAHAWEMTNTDALTLASLPDFWSALKKTEGGPARFALYGLRLPAEDEDLQAVSLAYAYAMGVAARADMIVYSSQCDEETGLWGADGRIRPAAEMFAALDGGLHLSQLNTCRRVSQAAYEVIRAMTPVRRSLLGTANGGEWSGGRRSVVAFADGDTHGFFAEGARTDPATQASAAWGEDVLFTWLDASEEPCSLRRVFDDGKALEGAVALSVQSLCQYPNANNCSITLTLSGSDRSGQMLTYRASATCVSGSWRTLGFYVAPFTTQADLASPLVLSLSVAPEHGATDEVFVFWLRGIDAVFAGGPAFAWVPLLLTLAGACSTFFICLFFYRRSVKKRERQARVRE